MNAFFSFISNIFTAIGAFFVGVAISIGSFFVPPQPVVVATSTPIAIVDVATSTPVVVPVVVPKPVPLPTKPPVVPKPVPKPIPVPTPIPQPPVVPEPPRGSIGTTTLAVQSIPLLSGGEVRGGKTVPVSYLQITNIGTAGALLTGFWLKQNGTATEEAVIGLKTVDDRGGSRGSAGGSQGDVLFHNGVAMAPTDAYFAPGQMRLFTIKAEIASNASPYIGMQLTLVVTALESTAAVQGAFPIVGTTWTIVN